MNVVFRSADLARDFAAIAIENQRGHGVEVVKLARACRPPGVEFAKHDAALILDGDFVERTCELHARHAPVRPEFNDGGRRRLQHVALEIFFGDWNHVLAARACQSAQESNRQRQGSYAHGNTITHAVRSLLQQTYGHPVVVAVY